MINKNIRKIIHYGLLIIIILYIITGFGITSYRIIEQLTFGLLLKPTASLIHFYLIYPLVVFLYLHIVITFNKN
ncbi:MAG: hypothetical protein BV457_00345 [Thermoplasmata archaeon M9B1D]|nr:MAG: hypothetical protein BV457_00345 [Thermoplasmata archaeon M9B1D]PNX52176.1 MAG: hypothetical protein BV456_00395 [Thermoplasmata archaeon M8B2D]